MNEQLDPDTTGTYDLRTAATQTLDARFTSFCLGWLMCYVE